jgi:hypothetical protein
MWELADRIDNVQKIVEESDGQNVANGAFCRQVDDLLSLFYDDIGEIKNIDLGRLFYLFLVKCLYINRQSSRPAVLGYLAEMLTRFLWTREMFPLGLSPHHYLDMLSLILQEMESANAYQNLFEFHRKLGDNALFLTGLFPAAIGRRTRRRRWFTATPKLDQARYVSFGQSNYLAAAHHDLAGWTGQRPTLTRLSEHFGTYMGALNEMSERYIMGFDLRLIADKMLDSINLYRRTGDERHRENASKYAALLKLDRGALAAAFRRRPRYTLLNEPARNQGRD